LGLYWLSLFILTHVPVPRVVQDADVSDKSLHFLAYLVLSFLLWSTFGGGKVKWCRPAPWLVLFAIALYGFLDEWLQGFVAGRSSDVWDFFSDLTGAVIGLLISSFLTFWPAGLAVTVIFIFGITNVTRASLANLLPVTNTMFHLFAYAILTVMWINCMHIFYAVKFLRAKWLISTMAGPIGFLIIVKLYSIMAGKKLAYLDIITAFVAITVVVVAYYIWYFQKQSREQRAESHVPNN